MPEIAWMNEKHFNHLIQRTLSGDEKAASDIRREWQLQRKRVERLKETGEDVTADEFRG